MFVIWSGALIIGITLGMLGSGGSAITVPVLVYLVGHGTKESIAESMAIVGLISIAAAIPYARARQIDWRSVWLFGIPGMVGTFLGAWLGGISPDSLQLSVFGIVLFLAAFSMFEWKQTQRDASVSQPPEDSPAADQPIHRSPMWKVALEGLVVGMLTGFVGVGGGFLIVPALVLLGKLSMRLAVGTSLLIIAAKSLVGFAKYEHHLQQVGSSADMQVVLLFFVIGAAGAFLGRRISAGLDQHVLKNVFAVFLILLGSFVVVREGSRLWEQPVEPGHANVTVMPEVHSSEIIPKYTKL